MGPCGERLGKLSILKQAEGQKESVSAWSIWIKTAAAYKP